MNFYVIDRNGIVINQSPFTERKAVEARRVYADNCVDILFPLTVVSEREYRNRYGVTVEQAIEKQNAEVA